MGTKKVRTFHAHCRCVHLLPIASRCNASVLYWAVDGDNEGVVRLQACDLRFSYHNRYQSLADMCNR